MYKCSVSSFKYILPPTKGANKKVQGLNCDSIHSHEVQALQGTQHCKTLGAFEKWKVAMICSESDEEATQSLTKHT